jgi:hypothetical protein
MFILRYLETLQKLLRKEFSCPAKCSNYQYIANPIWPNHQSYLSNFSLLLATNK